MPIEVVVYPSADFTIKTPCDDIPAIIRQIANCVCLDASQKLKAELEYFIQLALHFGEKYPLKMCNGANKALTLTQQPIWPAIIKHFQQFALSFEQSQTRDKGALLNTVSIRELIALLSRGAFKEWPREFRIAAYQRLFRSEKEIHPKVLESHVATVQDEKELFDDLLKVAESDTTALNEPTYKALFRLAENCDLSCEQMERLLSPVPRAFSNSRKIAGQFAIAAKLLQLHRNLRELPKSTICKISDALLAAPTAERGLAFQSLLLNACSDMNVRSYIMDNVTRTRAW